MAAKKVQEGDLVEVTFKNHSKLHRSGTYYYATTGSSHYASEMSAGGEGAGNDWAFIFFGGVATVGEIGDKYITFFDDPDEDATQPDGELRVEKTFIKSMKVLRRIDKFELSDGFAVGIPEDPTHPLLVYSYNEVDDEYSPAQVRQFLRDIKKHYVDGKGKPKSSKKRKGSKISFADFQSGMRVDVVPIDWNSSPDNVNAGELIFLYKGTVKNVSPSSDGDRLCFYRDNDWLTVRKNLIKELVLTRDWEDKYSDTSEVLGRRTIGGQEFLYYDDLVHIGCQNFELKAMLDLYKALVKVYGAPK